MIVTVRYGMGGVPLVPLASARVERAEQEVPDELLGDQEIDVESRGNLRLLDHCVRPPRRLELCDARGRIHQAMVAA